MTSPAADWLPFDLEVARREPGRIRHTVRPNARWIAFRGGVIDFTDDWHSFDDSKALRLAPAQPAAWNQCPHGVERHNYCALCVESEWHPTSILPAEGRVVELRFTWMQMPMLMFGYVTAEGWYATDEPEAKDGVLQGDNFDRKWRYYLPPGERAEATDGLGEFMRKAYEKLMGTPTINAGAEHGGQGILETASQEAPSAEHAPVPAPQRQNLAYWLGLRGRAPWPESKRVTLPGLPVSSFNVWGK